VKKCPPISSHFPAPLTGFPSVFRVGHIDSRRSFWPASQQAAVCTRPSNNGEWINGGTLRWTSLKCFSVRAFLFSPLFQEALRRQMNENVKLNCKWLGFGGLSVRGFGFGMG